MRFVSQLLAVFICIVFIKHAVEGWTQLCPQTNLQQACKCMPGERCCFCPKPKMSISHQHVASGVSEIISANSSPCSALVIPNGCTVGGVCPACNGLKREFTNDICVDDPSCTSMALSTTVCSQFSDVRYRYNQS